MRSRSSNKYSKLNIFNTNKDAPKSGVSKVITSLFEEDPPCLG